MELSNGREAGEATEIQAQAHVWNQTLNYVNSMSLKCAVELGIAEIIHNHGRPMTLTDLVSALGIPRARADSFHRLMRILNHAGFFARQTVERSYDHEGREEREGYVLTPPSQLLLKGNLLSMYPMVTLVLHPVITQQLNCLSKWFHSDSPNSPFEMQHGRACFDYTLQEPEFNRIMNEAMASDAPIVTGKIIEKCKNTFEHSKSVVDVGGGTGLLARGIADAFPHLEVTVVDLPHVVCGLEGTKNLKFLAGDMFKYIPPASTILLKVISVSIGNMKDSLCNLSQYKVFGQASLVQSTFIHGPKWILHDWDDEHCLNILKRCKEAITAGGKHGGKVMVIEMVMEGRKEDDAWTQTELFLDVLMMATAAGKERSEKEWAKLLLDAGFKDHRITPLVGSRCLIEVYP